jgi:hypothetical protein
MRVIKVSTIAKAKTPAKVRAAVKPAIMVVRVKIPAKAKAVAKATLLPKPVSIKMESRFPGSPSSFYIHACQSFQ